MSVLRYLLVIALIGLLALLSVTEHVERTRVGYSIRKLEREQSELLEEQKAAELLYERAVVPERLLERAADLRVADSAELQALVGAQR